MYRISGQAGYPAGRILKAGYTGYIEFSIQLTNFCSNTGKLFGENEKNVNNTIDRWIINCKIDEKKVRTFNIRPDILPAGYPVSSFSKKLDIRYPAIRLFWYPVHPYTISWKGNDDLHAILSVLAWVGK